MKIFDIQKQKIWYETLVDYLHATGVPPADMHVRQRIASTLHNGPGAPTFDLPTFHQWNPIDISMIYERMLWDLDVYIRAVENIDHSMASVLERSVQMLQIQQARLEKKLKALSSRLQTQTRWTFYDTFDTMKTIDMNNTSALIDTVAGNVTLPIKIDLAVRSRVLVDRAETTSDNHVHLVEIETDGSDAVDVTVDHPSRVEVYLMENTWVLAATGDVVRRGKIYHGTGNKIRVIARSIHGDPNLKVLPLHRRYLERATVQSKPFDLSSVPGYPGSSTYINVELSANIPASTEVQKELLLYYTDDVEHETPVSVPMPFGIGRSSRELEVSDYSMTSDGVYRLNTESMDGRAPYSSVYAGADGYLIYAKHHQVGPSELTVSQMANEMRGAPPEPSTFDVEQMIGFCRPQDLPVVRKYVSSISSYYYQPDQAPGEDLPKPTFAYLINAKLPSNEVLQLHGLLIGGDGVQYSGSSSTLACLEPGWAVRYSTSVYSDSDISATLSLVVVAPNGYNPVDVGMWVNGAPQISIFGNNISFVHRKVSVYLQAGWNNLDVVLYIDYLSLRIPSILGLSGGVLVGWSIPSGLIVRAVPDKLRKVNAFHLRTAVPVGRTDVWAPSPDNNYIEIARPYPSRALGSIRTQPMPYKIITRAASGIAPKHAAYRLTLLTRDPSVTPVVDDCRIEVYDIE
jgi:hypothetical protein